MSGCQLLELAQPDEVHVGAGHGFGTNENAGRLGSADTTRNWVEGGVTYYTGKKPDRFDHELRGLIMRTHEAVEKIDRPEAKEEPQSDPVAIPWWRTERGVVAVITAIGLIAGGGAIAKRSRNGGSHAG